MELIRPIFGSSLGRKYLMAVTGLLLVLFVLFHMAGNLQLFAGRAKLNAYAHFLKSTPLLLWGGRLGLLAVVLVHLWTSISLTRTNRAAHPQNYAVANANGASYASRTMVWGGLIIAAFVVYHLLHFTVGITHPELFAAVELLPDGTRRHDVFALVVRSFQQPLVSGFYLLAMGLLGLHLSHGVSSLFQSLGVRRESNRVAFDRLAFLLALLIFLGNSSMPIAVLLGYGQDLVR